MRFFRINRCLAAIFLVTSLLASAIPVAAYGQEGPCEAGLKKCFADALITAAMAGAYAGIGYAAWCSVSYVWCIKYVD